MLFAKIQIRFGIIHIAKGKNPWQREQHITNSIMREIHMYARSNEGKVVPCTAEALFNGTASLGLACFALVAVAMVACHAFGEPTASQVKDGDTVVFLGDVCCHPTLRRQSPHWPVALFGGKYLNFVLMQHSISYYRQIVQAANNSY